MKTVNSVSPVVQEKEDLVSLINDETCEQIRMLDEKNCREPAITESLPNSGRLGQSKHWTPLQRK